MSSLFDLTGRRALVTGASRGLGEAMARALAAHGAEVVLVARSSDDLQRVVDGISAKGGRAHAVPCDLADSGAAESMVEQVEREIGPIEVLVNNAGLIRRSPAEEYPVEAWEEVLALDLSVPFRLAQTVGRGMLDRGEGSIITIASLLSFSGGLNVAAYTAAKHGVAGITRALANEWGARGVRVNAIAPGYFHTAATAAIQENPERYEALRRRIPMGRWGEPEDLAGAVVFLASRASAYVNGHILAVDGGWLAG